MEDHYVSYECAQALKRLGFAEKVSAVWHFDGEEWNLIPDYGATFQHTKDIPHWNESKVWGAHIYSAPRLDQAAAWLREVQGLNVLADIARQKALKGKYYWGILDKDADFVDVARYRLKLFDTYEAALSAGIDVALKQLEDNGKEQ